MAEFEDDPIPARLRALGRGHLVVEASAGTGKTFTLEHLVLREILGGTPITSIAIVTFTDKATREMRARLRARLVDARPRLPRTLRARVDEALASFEHATITTIHGFCHQALRRAALAVGGVFDAELVDGSALFGRVLRDQIRRGLSRTRSDRIAWLAAVRAFPQAPVAQLEALLASHRAERARREPAFDPARVLAALDRLVSLALDTSAFRKTIDAIPDSMLRIRVRDVWLELVHRALPAALPPATDPLFDPRVTGFLGWARETVTGLDEPNILVLANGLGDHPQLGAEVRWLSQVGQDIVPYALTALLPRVLDAYRDHKASLGVRDFEDVLVELHERLADPEVVERVRGELRIAFVDEFQDTDEVQWGIVRRLFVEPEGQRVVVIGDPKQAIYGFRSADVHTFVAARDSLIERGAEVLRLDASFRASEALLEATQRVLFPSDGAFFGGFLATERPIVCGRPERRLVGPSGEALPSLLLAHLVGMPELRAGRLREAFAGFIADECLRVQDGQLAVEGPSPRVLRLRDVFVLTRTAAEARVVAEGLRARGVPHAFFRQTGLFRSREARDLLDVLTAVAEPTSRQARLRAWLTPFFAVSPSELRRAECLEPSHPAHQMLFRWARLAERGHLATLFARIVDESGFARRVLYLHPTERALVNTQHVLEIVLEAATAGRLQLFEVVAWLEERILRAERGALEAEDHDVQRLESDRDAVQLLTMHKSKGLEAEVVFLCGGFHRPPARPFDLRVMHEGDERVVWVGPEVWGDPREEARLWARFQAETVEEDQRLHYVAMTRAKSRLVLPYVGPPPVGAARRPDVTYDLERFNGGYRVVNDALVGLATRGELATPSIEVREVEVRARRRGPSPRPTLPESVAAEPVTVASPARLEALKSAALAAEVSSYSRMKQAASATEPEEASVEALLREAEAAGHSGPQGAPFGVLVHGLIEDALRTSQRRPEAWHGRLALHDETTRTLAVELADAALDTPIDTACVRRRSGLRDVGRRAVEMPFAFELTPGSGASGWLRGVVDLLFEEAGRVYVVDWKTDVLDRYDPSFVREHSLREYGVQAALYTVAAARALDLDEAGFEARFGGLLYVFVRGLGPGAPTPGIHAHRPSFSDLARWERALREGHSLEGAPLPRRGAPEVP